MNTSFKDFYLYLPTFIFLIISAYLTSNVFYTNVDVGWHIQVGKFITQGKLLYRDVTEVNFPIIYYSKVIPIFFANLFGLSVVIATEVFHYFLILSSVILSAYIFSKLEHDYVKKLLVISLISFVLLILPFGINRNQMGQKEHYFIIFILPYFLLSCSSSLNLKILFSHKIRFFIGFLGGVAICMKPYFIIPYIALQVVVLMKDQSIKSYFRRAELWGSVTFGLLFLAIFMTIFYDHYQVNILPIIKYTYYTHSIILYNYFLKLFIKEALIIGLVIYFYNKNSPFLLPAALLHFSCFIVSLMQNKSIDSIKYPMYSFEIIFLGLLAFLVIKNFFRDKNHLLKKHNIAKYFIPIITLIIIFSRIIDYSSNFTKNYGDENAFNRDKYVEFTEYLEALNTKNIMVIAPTLGYSFPAFHNLELNWKWRYSAYRVDPDRFYVEKETITKRDIENIRNIEIEAITSLGDLVAGEKFEYLVIQTRKVFDIDSVWDNLETKNFSRLTLHQLLTKYYPEYLNQYQLVESKLFNLTRFDINRRVKEN